MRRLAFLSLFATVAACSAREEPTGTTSQALVSGAKDTQDVAVVQVLIQHATNPTPETSFQCSGTVVSPHVVVTAAHCLSPDIVGPGESWYVFYGDDSNDPAELSDRHNFGYAKSVTPHPDFDPKSIGSADAVKGDLGVIVLLDPAPVTPIALAHDAPAVGAEVHVLGYGMRTPGDAATTGVRSDTTQTIAAVDARSLSFAGGAHSLCEGDSGGPSLLGGKLAGVHSYIEHATSCTGMNYDARVDAYAAWIETAIRSADPSFLPPEPVDAGVDASTDDAGAPGDSAAPPPGGSSGGCAASPRSPVGALVLALMASLAVARRRRAA
jgi:uncharacterized protein (TIGR03382 family)